MKRVFLFIVTNLAILLVLSVTLRLLGVERILDEQGVDLNLRALLIFSAVFGMGGAFISLAISKWTAKRLTGAQVIERPANELETWLVGTVQDQARRAGIGTGGQAAARSNAGALLGVAVVGGDVPESTVPKLQAYTAGPRDVTHARETPGVWLHSRSRVRAGRSAPHARPNTFLASGGSSGA